ncbi:MAG TPA: hypothetical protein VEW66_08535 [Thermomicrobiales bacterium]|nr:hypothetical protein [Thermomicrobiales bacterium]
MPESTIASGPNPAGNPARSITPQWLVWALAPGTMLGLTPERTSELCVVVAAVPGITVAEARNRYGSVLYYALFQELPGEFSTARTPGGSTLTASTSPC